MSFKEPPQTKLHNYNSNYNQPVPDSTVVDMVTLEGIVWSPGADLASYPLGQVPDEAAPIVRALLMADKNQQFARSRMTYAAY